MRVPSVIVHEASLLSRHRVCQQTAKRPFGTWDEEGATGCGWYLEDALQVFLIPERL
jgi:hypothetical protein